MPRTWPNYNDPSIMTLAPTGLWRSDRSLAGPLRRGTAGDVGPRALGGANRYASDLGTDRVSPRSHDPIGRDPYTAESTRVRR